MFANIKVKCLKILCFMGLLFGQSSFADEPTLMDWYKMVAPNYVQFQKVYGSQLDDTVFSQMFRPSSEQIFSDKPLSSEQVQLGAGLSNEAYYHCMVWGYHWLTMMYGDDDLDEIADYIFGLCQDHEDVYDIYSILLAADRYHVPMTEKKAWQRILENKEKGIRDNSDFRQAVRERIYQLKSEQLKSEQ